MRQSLDDGGLANTRLTDQYRIVLGAALQDLDGATDFVVATNHRIELALTRTLGQIHGVFLERLALSLGLGTVDLLSAAHRIDGRFQRALAEARILQNTAGRALVFGQRQQEHFAGDEFVTTLLGVLVSGIEQCCGVTADLHLAGSAPCTAGIESSRL